MPLFATIQRAIEPPAGPAAAPSWYFLAPLHLVLMAGFLLLTGALIAARRRLAGAHKSTDAARLDGAVGVLAILGVLAVNAWYCRPAHFEARTSLPLQLCDLAAMVAPIALITSARWARTLLHFWGFVLAPQGLLSPVHRPALDNPLYWLTWINHGLIVGPALYDVFARGYRPRWRDWRLAVFVTLLYAGAAFSFDAATGFNYGYLGSDPPAAGGETPATLLDLLGPWPWRAGAVITVAFLAFTALMAAWTAVGTWWPPGEAYHSPGNGPSSPGSG